MEGEQFFETWSYLLRANRLLQPLHDFLVLNFQDMPGLPYIEKDEYRFGDPRDSLAFIHPTNWTDVVRQGENVQLEMSILDRQRCRPLPVCPWCDLQAPQETFSEETGRVTWYV